MVDKTTTMDMAWNEPGSGGNKPKPDPWGKGNDSPPDLDKIFKDLHAKLRGMFSFGKNFGKKNAGKTGDAEPRGNVSYGLLLIIFAVLYIVSGLYIVKPAEQAVITRFGKYNRTVGPGPHWYPSFVEKKEVVNTEELVSTREAGTMLTGDENLVSVEIQVQYRILDVNSYLFKIVDPEKSLRQAAESALRQAVGHNKLDFIITSGRVEIEEQTRKQIIATLEGYNAGLYVAAVTLKEAKAPDQVKNAFDDVTKAREDRERFIHEAESYYNKIVPEAKGQAQQMLQEAEAYKQEAINSALGDTQRFSMLLPEYKKAPQVTKTRLYLDALEQVFSNSSKILVDIAGGNNLVYLPIDKLMAQGKVDADLILSKARDAAIAAGPSRNEDPAVVRSYDRRRDSE